MRCQVPSPETAPEAEMQTMRTDGVAGDEDGIVGDGRGPDDATVCARCRHIIIRNKSDPWWRWECMAHALPAKFNPVTGETVADPPYRLCKNVNWNGDCKQYSEGPNRLNPRETEE